MRNLAPFYLWLRLTLCCYWLIHFAAYVGEAEQNPMRAGGGGKPPLMLGVSYEFYSEYRQLTIDFGFFPAFGEAAWRKKLHNWPLSLLQRKHPRSALARALLPLGTSSTTRASLMELGLGVSRADGAAPALRWRAALLDFDATGHIVPLQWRRSRDDHHYAPEEPLYPMRPRSPFRWSHGMTLLSFDRAGMFESETRWLELRGGFEYSNRRKVAAYYLHNKLTILAALTAAGALSSREIGARHFPRLRRSAEGEHSGADLRGEARLGLQYDLRARLSVDASLQHSFAANSMLQRRLGVNLDVFIPLFFSAEISDSQLQLLLRYEEIFLQAHESEARIHRLQTGLQLSFGP